MKYEYIRWQSENSARIRANHTDDQFNFRLHIQGNKQRNCLPEKGEAKLEEGSYKSYTSRSRKKEKVVEEPNHSLGKSISKTLSIFQAEIQAQ